MFLGTSSTESFQIAKRIRKSLVQCELKEFVEIIDSLIASVPYEIFDDKTKEHAYELIFYTLSIAIGVDCRCESSVADGRSDLVVYTDKYIYVIEFKFNHSAESALNQIEDNGYARPYKADGRAVYRIGASFSSEKRNIQRWLVQAPNGEITEVVIN